MISVIFVACLLAGSALGYPWVNRPIQYQPYIQSHTPAYAVYPCESNEDPNGVWLDARNQRQYVYIAECQQFNSQSGCVVPQFQNNVRLQSQPIMYIQPTNNCQTQACEQICVKNSCFLSSVMTPSTNVGHQIFVERPNTEKPAEITTTTTTTTPAPAPAAVPPYQFVQYPYYPPQPSTYQVPNLHFYQNQYTNPSVAPESSQSTTEASVSHEPSVSPVIEETSSTEAPKQIDMPTETVKIEETEKISEPEEIVSKKVECKSAYECAPVSQQHVIYYQPASSSSAASAASAGSASASASASAGSASASASAASSSPYLSFPGISYQHYQQYQQNQGYPCKSTDGSAPCNVHYKKSASVNKDGINIVVSGDNDTEEEQSPCGTSPCLQ